MIKNSDFYCQQDYFNFYNPKKYLTRDLLYFRVVSMVHACIVLPLSIYALYFEGELPKVRNCNHNEFIYCFFHKLFRSSKYYFSIKDVNTILLKYVKCIKYTISIILKLRATLHT